MTEPEAGAAPSKNLIPLIPADSFVNRDHDARVEVGNLHSGFKAHDIEGFWRGVGELAPEFISEKDLDYLISVDDGSGAWLMIGAFEHIGVIHLKSASGVISSLRIIAHLYR